MKKQRLIRNIPIDYTQERLTVVSEAYSVRLSPTRTVRYVDCMCSCGITKQVKVSQITSGKAKSCGCLSRATLQSNISKREAGIRAVLRVYNYSAKDRGLDFSLDRETFERLTTSNCVYCGVEPLQFQTRFSEFKYNGIDRVDNTKGYILENCVPCCKLCNRMKDVLSVEDFKSHINKIITFRKETAFCQKL